MNIYQVTLEGDTQCWLAKGVKEAMELACQEQISAEFHPDDLEDMTCDDIEAFRRKFDQELLEAVVYIGEVANP